MPRPCFTIRRRACRACVPTLAIAARNDTPYLHLDGVVRLIPGSVKMEYPHDNPETLATDAETAALARMVAGWLDG